MNIRHTIPELYRSHREFFWYCVIGVSGATLDFFAYWLFVHLGMAPELATFISTSIGIINNFIWNVFLNFRTTSHLLLRFLSFYLIGLFGTLLSVVLIYVLTGPFHFGPLVAKLITIVPVVLIQYIFNKFVTFSRHPCATASMRK